MKIQDFMDNLLVFFKDMDEDIDIVRLDAVELVRKNGDAVEIRILNPEYEEILTVSRNGIIEAISSTDLEGVLKSSKKE
jgi:hypothetical protein